MTEIPVAQSSTPCPAAKCSAQAQRLQMPVAPRANARSRFAPPGKTNQALLPNQAITWLEGILNQGATIAEVEISGPGDPLAAPDPTLETLQLLRDKHPELPVRLITMGIGGNQFAESFVALGIKKVTIMVDAVAPTTLERLYSWIRPTNKTLPLPKAAAILVTEQAKAVASLSAVGMEITVKTTVYPGINNEQVGEIAKSMAKLGATKMTLAPFTPPATEIDAPPAADPQLMTSLSQQAAQYIKIDEDPKDMVTRSPHGEDQNNPAQIPKPSKERPNVAVVSSNGMDIDLHLGHAIKVIIYGPREDGLPCLLEMRDAPEPGGGGSRWEALATILPDCFALLAASAGDNPRKILGSNGITVLISEDNVEGTVDVLYGGGKKGKKKCR